MIRKNFGNSSIASSRRSNADNSSFASSRRSDSGNTSIDINSGNTAADVNVDGINENRDNNIGGSVGVINGNINGNNPNGNYANGNYPNAGNGNYAGGNYPNPGDSNFNGSFDGGYNDMRNAAYDAGYRAAMEDMQRQGRRGPGNFGAGVIGEGYYGAADNGSAYSKPVKKRKRHPIRNFIIILLILAIAGGTALATTGYAALGRLMEASVDQEFRDTPQTLNDGVAYDESMMGKRSIALVGLDSRDGDLLRGNSDTMIVATMDNSRRSMKMFSVYRDTYLDVIVGEAVYRKANNAYATGGPARMVTMLNRNLDLNITDYVTVDFKALQVAVDDLGGIDVEMTDDEVVWMNDNGWETAEVCGVKWWYVEPGAGTYHLNGVQAVSYARIRKTTGNDFKRTSRQRLVISKVIDRAKKAGPAALTRMAEDVFPLIRTSLTEKDLLLFAMGVVFYDTDNAQGFPFVHLEKDVNGMDVVVPVTLEHNVKELHKWLFGVEDYAPSKTVRDISSYIASASGLDDSDIGRAAEYSANGANPDSGSEADGH